MYVDDTTIYGYNSKNQDDQSLTTYFSSDIALMAQWVGKTSL